MTDRPDSQESRSSVKITLNAKGDRQVEVKVYVGDTEAEVDYVRDLAIRAFHSTVSTLANWEGP